MGGTWLLYRSLLYLVWLAFFFFFFFFFFFLCFCFFFFFFFFFNFFVFFFFFFFWCSGSFLSCIEFSKSSVLLSHSAPSFFVLVCFCFLVAFLWCCVLRRDQAASRRHTSQTMETAKSKRMCRGAVVRSVFFFFF